MLAGPQSKRVEHRKLAVKKARLEGSIPVREFERLAAMLCEDAGEINFILSFRKGRKRHPLVLGECTGTLAVICQNCLDPLTLDIKAAIRTLIVPDEAEFEALGLEENGLVCETEQISLVDLLEDDLILCLPMVPKHLPGRCQASEGAVSREEDRSNGSDADTVQETHRPFAGLAAFKEDLNRS